MWVLAVMGFWFWILDLDLDLDLDFAMNFGWILL